MTAMRDIDIWIQSTPDRVRMTRLVLDLLKDPLTHTDYADVMVHFDKSGTPWGGLKHILENADRSREYLMVMQNDILPCPHFLLTVEQIVSQNLPDNPISFFSPKPVVSEALRQGKHFAKTAVWFCAQAYILPMSDVDAILEYNERHIKAEERQDDRRLASFYFKHNRPVYLTAPSLVEHLGWNSTTAGEQGRERLKNPKGRVADSFIGFENSAFVGEHAINDWRIEDHNDLPFDDDGHWGMFNGMYIE